MPLHSGPTFLRTSLGRLAVTGAASLVTVMGVAPAAMADDDLAPESSSTDQTSAEPAADQQAAPATPDAEAPAPDAEPDPVAQQPEETPADETPAAEAPVDEPPIDEAPVDQPPADEPAATDEATEEELEVSAAAATLTLQDDAATGRSGRTVSIDVLANDSSSDAIESLTIEDQGEHGTAYVVGSRSDDLSTPVPGAGSLRVEVDVDDAYVGDDTVTYRVTTVDGTTETATIDLDVAAVTPPVTPSYGDTKFRVGVQLADGSYAPAGSSTLGSVFRVVETRADGTTGSSFTCTTSTTGSSPTPTYTECRRITGVDGSSYAITQVSAPDGFVPSPRRQVVEPCDYGPGGSTEFCAVGFDLNGSNAVVFSNRGSVLPDAVDDRATSSGGDSVDVDVLENDDSEDPRTSLEVATQPSGGTAEVVGSAVEPEPQPEPQPEPEPQPGPGPIEFPGPIVLRHDLDRVGVLAVPNAGTQVVRYTPDPGFEGVDSFTYRLTNGNGSDTATVRVRVSDNGAVMPVDPADPADTDDSDAAPASATLRGSGSGTVGTVAASLPSTGGPRTGLLALGAALVATGAAAVAGSRRRRDVTGG